MEETPKLNGAKSLDMSDTEPISLHVSREKVTPHFCFDLTSDHSHRQRPFSSGRLSKWARSTVSPCLSRARSRPPTSTNSLPGTDSRLSTHVLALTHCDLQERRHAARSPDHPSQRRASHTRVQTPPRPLLFPRDIRRWRQQGPLRPKRTRYCLLARHSRRTRLTRFTCRPATRRLGRPTS